MILSSFLQGAHPSPLTGRGCMGSLEEPTTEDRMRPSDSNEGQAIQRREPSRPGRVSVGPGSQEEVKISEVNSERVLSSGPWRLIPWAPMDSSPGLVPSSSSES